MAEQTNPPVEAEVANTAKTAELVSVCARVNDFYNPYTKQRFYQFDTVTDVPLDSWLQSQIDAGYIDRV